MRPTKKDVLRADRASPALSDRWWGLLGMETFEFNHTVVTLYPQEDKNSAG